MDKHSKILITGGTGSFGKEFVKVILEKWPDINRLVIFSRDELKQFEMSQTFNEKKYPGIRYFLGDIRDKNRLKRALDNIDIVIHAAALKQVPTAEYNPFEFVKTNIIGAENIIDASLSSNVKKIIALSTDKACAPLNLYGATKLCSDKLFISANNIKGSRDINFSVVRYGNVFGSRGSVVPLFFDMRKMGILKLTHPKMTRFNITLGEGINLVLWALKNLHGGEIIVPKLPSYRLCDLANAIDPNCKKEFVGLRPGEKIHEEMITSDDSLNTFDLGNIYSILPDHPDFQVESYIKKFKAKKVPEGFSYNSGTNKNFLNSFHLQELLKNYMASS